MKQIIIFLLLGLTSVLFLGCINIEPALSGKEYEEYQKNIKPVLYYWNKTGATGEQKTKDWMNCGGDADGGWHYIRGATQKQEDIRSKNADNCMIKKGYTYERTR
ncbi:MAG: hypothetical protein M0Q90_17500 [Bacteroidales bacterium]|nr:hypothetical protein [Bacteroidales bacterium]